MPHDFVGEEFRSGSAAQCFCAVPCRVDWGHVWYLVGRWAAWVWRIGGSFTQNSSTSSGSWLSAQTGLAWKGWEGEEEREERGGEESRVRAIMGNLLLEDTLLHCLSIPSFLVWYFQTLHLLTPRGLYTCFLDERTSLGINQVLGEASVLGPKELILKSSFYNCWEFDQINLIFLINPFLLV